ncbi:MAG: GNAT family N-acetyltransferase [Ferruginibacter sp.]|nr:GNAT family N-acetyltransferase [Ferruginibacter sp.]
MLIKKVEEFDLDTITSLAKEIWPIAYNNIICAEQIEYMLHLMYSKHALIQQLQKGHQFIIALSDTTPIGFASFSKKSFNEKKTIRLNKLYVLTNTQQKGVGSFLLDYVCAESRKQGATTIELNVNKHNPATQFYFKKGFTILKEEVLQIGNGFVMDDYVMVKKL